jgi:predicted transcriptional regulator
LLHILRNLENPCAGLIYRRILDISNFVVNHVSLFDAAMQPRPIGIKTMPTNKSTGITV